MRVDMKTILLAQRVDQHWQGTITNSSRLQKKLFFTAATPEDLHLLRLADPSSKGYTLMVRQSAFEAATRDKLGIAGIALEDYAQSNPFFPRASSVPTKPPARRTARYTRSAPAEVARPTFELPATAVRTDGIRPSWTRMFITQPPNLLCWLPQRADGPTATQDTFVAYGTDDQLYTSVAMCGFAMLGKYYWDAVERFIEASPKKKAAPGPHWG